MRMRTQTLIRVFATCCLLVLCGSAAAQDEDATAEQEALAKTVQNPLAALISLPFQANYNHGVGEHDRTFFNLNIQPVIPYPGEKWNIITRTIIPVNSVPMGEIDSVAGFGDTSFSLFFSPAKAGSLTWGVGPALTIPSASNPEVLGSGKLSLGPSGVLFLGLGKWTMGAVASNVWSVAGTATETTSTSSSPSFPQLQHRQRLGSGHGTDPHRQLGSRPRQPVGDSVGPPSLQGDALRPTRLHLRWLRPTPSALGYS